MAAFTSKCLLVFTLVACAASDDIDVELSSGMMMKVLREMANQTKGDTLNLPANASSIRENITDTFSCENRTYGYYADVDNDCQIFHVCLPSQSPSGRNVTYRWSFICPNETIFNQEVLVCTRPIDSVPCEEAEMYYYVNMEFGKVNNTKEENEQSNQTENDKDKTEKTPNDANNKPENTPVKSIDRRNKIQKRKQNIIDNRKPNIIPEELLKDIVNDEIIREELEVMGMNEDAEINPDNLVFNSMENKPQNLEVSDQIAVGDADSRLATERSLKWNARRNGRGAFRFKADV